MLLYFLIEVLNLISSIKFLDIIFKSLSNNLSKDKMFFSNLFKNDKSYLLKNFLSTKI